MSATDFEKVDLTRFKWIHIEASPALPVFRGAQVASPSSCFASFLVSLNQESTLEISESSFPHPISIPLCVFREETKAHKD